MNPRSPTVHANVIVETTSWYGAIHDIKHLVKRTCYMVQRCGGSQAHYGSPPSILFSNDTHIKKLNFRFRGQNKPTNVLTFDPPNAQYGGDIVLAFETMRREAQRAQRPLKTHVTHLLIHGLLHLAGHDHHHPGEARHMETLETYIMRRMGLPDPWKVGGKPHI